jgi:hypothetical protein
VQAIIAPSKPGLNKRCATIGTNYQQPHSGEYRDDLAEQIHNHSDSLAGGIDKLLAGPISCRANIFIIYRRLSGGTIRFVEYLPVLRRRVSFSQAQI